MCSMINLVCPYGDMGLVCLDSCIGEVFGLPYTPADDENNIVGMSTPTYAFMIESNSEIVPATLFL